MKKKTIHFRPRMTYFSLPCELHEGQKERASILNKDKLMSVGQPTRQNRLLSSHTLKSSERVPQTDLQALDAL